MDCGWVGRRIVSPNSGPRNQLAVRAWLVERSWSSAAGGAWLVARGWAGGAWADVAGRAPRRRLLCEFGDGGREQMGPGLAGIEGGGQCRFGFGQALPATCADAQFPGEIAQTACAAFDGGSDLSV